MFENCVRNFYYRGKAKSLGSVFDEHNAEIRAAYIARFSTNSSCKAESYALSKHLPDLLDYAAFEAAESEDMLANGLFRNL